MTDALASAAPCGHRSHKTPQQLSGTQGNFTVLQNCATDSSKYFDLTTSGAIVTTLNNIGRQITNLRVSK